MAEHRLKIQENKQTQDVADFNKYKAAENSSFDLIMSQMNIADQSDFTKQFAQQWQEAAIEKKQLAVLLCEIDFFKEYLHSYGKQGASFMLLSVALALKTICEQQGCFLALDEQKRFVILMKGGDEKRVLKISESLCNAVKASRTEHKYSTVSDIVTLSVGVSALYPKTMAILKTKAHNALQNANNLGGNKISNDNKKRAAKLITEPATDNPGMFAPKLNISAPNAGKIDLFAEPQKEESKNKPAAVKMYRGHIISD